MENPPLKDQTKPSQTGEKPRQAGRRYSRLLDNGSPVHVKAEKIKAKKNALGNKNNPFTILQSIDNSHFANIAIECDLVLGDDKNGIDEFIDILKAKELAQAEIIRFEKAKTAKSEEIIVEECSDSDEDAPGVHMGIVEELTRTTDDIPLLEAGTCQAGRGKKKVKFK